MKTRVLKFRLAFWTSAFAAVTTIVFGLLYEIRFSSLVYRSLVSLAAFWTSGYIIGLIIDRYTEKNASRLKTKGQTIDIITKEEENSECIETSFSPLTPDKFEFIASETSSSSGRGVYNERQ